MKIVVSSIFLLLAFSILSFGMPTFANAQSTVPPLSVSTDFPAYAENSEIIISGIVKDSSLSEYEQPITLMIVNSDGNIVKIAQLTLTSNNDFSTTLVAGGPLWKSGGEIFNEIQQRTLTVFVQFLHSLFTTNLIGQVLRHGVW